MADELGELESRLNRLADALTYVQLKQVMTKLGVEAKKDITAAAKRDLGGDTKFSGWKRVSLNSGFRHRGRGRIIIDPKPLGPWRVAEEGRSAASKHGATAGKFTWTDAIGNISDETPQRALDAIYDTARKILYGR